MATDAAQVGANGQSNISNFNNHTNPKDPGQKTAHPFGANSISKITNKMGLNDPLGTEQVLATDTVSLNIPANSPQGSVLNTEAIRKFPFDGQRQAPAPPTHDL